MNTKTVVYIRVSPGRVRVVLGTQLVGGEKGGE